MGQGGQSGEVTRCKRNQNHGGPSSSHHSSPVNSTLCSFLLPKRRQFHLFLSSLILLGQVLFLTVLWDYYGSIRHTSCLFRGIILLVSGILPTFPAGLFHVTTCLLLSLHPSQILLLVQVFLYPIWRMSQSM